MTSSGGAIISAGEFDDLLADFDEPSEADLLGRVVRMPNKSLATIVRISEPEPNGLFRCEVVIRRAKTYHHKGDHLIASFDRHGRRRSEWRTPQQLRREENEEQFWVERVRELQHSLAHAEGELARLRRAKEQQG